MPCYHPLVARYEGNKVKVIKKVGLEWAPLSLEQGYFNLPCGKCIGCRLKYSREWAVRCLHEGQMHESNCFITLTFDEPSRLARKNPESLDKKEFQDFMKRLRERIKPQKVRYFHCGEYGEKSERPHYHALLFGYDFPERKPWTKVNGYQYYTDESLAELWPYGFSIIGELSFDSAAYVARYIMKKQGGEAAPDRGKKVLSTGEIVEAEYCTQSRRPGIGYEWYMKYGATDVHANDTVVPKDKNMVMRPPRYYDKLLEETNPERFEEIKKERRARAPEPVLSYNEEVDRMWVTEECKEIKGQRYERDPEKVRF